MTDEKSADKEIKKKKAETEWDELSHPDAAKDRESETKEDVLEQIKEVSTWEEEKEEPKTKEEIDKIMDDLLDYIAFLRETYASCQRYGGRINPNRDRMRVIENNIEETKRTFVSYGVKSLIEPEKQKVWKRDVEKSGGLYYSYCGIRAIRMFENKYAKKNAGHELRTSDVNECISNVLSSLGFTEEDEKKIITRIVARYAEHGEELAEVCGIPEDEYKIDGKSIIGGEITSSGTEEEIEKEEIEEQLRRVRMERDELILARQHAARIIHTKESKEHIKELQRMMNENWREYVLLNAKLLIEPEKRDEWEKDVVDKDIFIATHGIHAIRFFEELYSRSENKSTNIDEEELKHFIRMCINSRDVIYGNRICRIVARYSKHGEELAKACGIPEDEYRMGGKSILDDAEGDGEKVHRGMLSRRINKRAYWK